MSQEMPSKEDEKSALRNLSCLLPSIVASMRSQPYPSGLGGKHSMKHTIGRIRFLFVFQMGLSGFYHMGSGAAW